MFTVDAQAAANAAGASRPNRRGRSSSAEEGEEQPGQRRQRRRQMREPAGGSGARPSLPSRGGTVAAALLAAAAAAGHSSPSSSAAAGAAPARVRRVPLAPAAGGVAARRRRNAAAWQQEAEADQQPEAEEEAVSGRAAEQQVEAASSEEETESEPAAEQAAATPAANYLPLLEHVTETQCREVARQHYGPGTHLVGSRHHRRYRMWDAQCSGGPGRLCEGGWRCVERGCVERGRGGGMLWMPTWMPGWLVMSPDASCNRCDTTCMPEECGLPANSTGVLLPATMCSSRRQAWMQLSTGCGRQLPWGWTRGLRMIGAATRGPLGWRARTPNG